MSPKQSFSNLLKNLVINFYWICSIMNIYICCSCTNSIFGKIFVPEIWAKMFSANQIAEYFNQTYLQHKSVICPDILHVDTNSHKLSLSKHSWVGTIKNGCGQSSYGTLYIVLYILDLAVAERILWNRRCPSFLPVCLSGCFLGIGSLDFSEFWHGASNPYEVVCDRAGFFGKTCFAQKLGKGAKIKPKECFLN